MNKNILSPTICFLEISLITIAILPSRLAAVVAYPHQCKQNPAVSVVGLPWWEVRRSLHQHPFVADTAFAHIISSQQSPALSTSISTVMMEIHFLTKHWRACVLHLCEDIRAIWFHNTDGKEIFFGFEGDVSWNEMQNPKLSVDYTKAKLSFVLTICVSLTCNCRKLHLKVFNSQQVHVKVFVCLLTFFKVAVNNCWNETLLSV